MYDKCEKHSTEQSSKHSHSSQRRPSTCPKHSTASQRQPSTCPKHPTTSQRHQQHPICQKNPVASNCPPAGCCNGQPISIPIQEPAFTVTVALDNQTQPTKQFPNNNILDGAPILFTNIAPSLPTSSVILNNGYIQILKSGAYRFDFTVEIEENAEDFPVEQRYDSTVQLLMVVPSGVVPAKNGCCDQAVPATSPSVIILNDSSTSISSGQGTITGTYTVHVPKPNTLIALRNAFDGVRLILKRATLPEFSASMTITKVPSP